MVDKLVGVANTVGETLMSTIVWVRQDYFLFLCYFYLNFDLKNRHEKKKSRRPTEFFGLHKTVGLGSGGPWWLMGLIALARPGAT
jgi:hypothetical protein